jgi:hypothetical protein
MPKQRRKCVDDSYYAGIQKPSRTSARLNAKEEKHQVVLHQLVEKKKTRTSTSRPSTLKSPSPSKPPIYTQVMQINGVYYYLSKVRFQFDSG